MCHPFPSPEHLVRKLLHVWPDHDSGGLGCRPAYFPNTYSLLTYLRINQLSISTRTIYICMVCMYVYTIYNQGEDLNLNEGAPGDTNSTLRTTGIYIYTYGYCEFLKKCSAEGL